MNIQRFVCNDFQENCYVVSDETHEGVVIDCGAFYPEERASIVDYIRKEGIRLKHLLATHGHVDHNFGNNTINDEFGLLAEVHSADLFLMQNLEQQCLDFCGHGIGAEEPPAGRLLSDGDVVEFGSHRLEVISTPGHSPGSVMFYCREEAVAFSGDTLFRMSIGRTDFEGGNYQDIITSLGRLAYLMEGQTVILPGHGPKTTLRDEIQMNPYMR